MRRIVITLSALLLLIGLVAGGGVAAAGEDSRSKQRDDHKAKHLTLYAEETSNTTIPAGGDPVEGEPDEPPSAGDRFVIVDTLYRDADRTDEVGRNLVECTFISATGETEEEFAADLLCHGVVTLDGKGDIAWQAQTSFSGGEQADPDTPFVTVAITGGTGAFQKAGGQAEIFDISEEGEDAPVLSRYEIELRKFKTERR